MNRAIARPNVTQLAKDIRVPTMVVAGRFDQVRPPAASEQFARDHSQCALRVDRRRAHDAGAGGGRAARAVGGFPGRAIRIHAGRTAGQGVNAMKLKANGITINYQVDGPEGAPWLVFSNSLATNLTMWDEQAPCARAAVSRAAVRSARTRRHRRARRPLQLRDAAGRRHCAAGRARDPEGAFRRAVDGRRHRARPGGGPPRPARPGHRLRLALPVDAGEHPAMGGAHRRRPEAGHRSTGRAHRRHAGFRRRRSRPIRRTSTRSVG